MIWDLLHNYNPKNDWERLGLLLAVIFGFGLVSGFAIAKVLPHYPNQGKVVGMCSRGDCNCSDVTREQAIVFNVLYGNINGFDSERDYDADPCESNPFAQSTGDHVTHQSYTEFLEDYGWLQRKYRKFPEINRTQVYPKGYPRENKGITK